MNNHTAGPWSHGKPFEPGKHTMREVISVSAGSMVIAHVNTAWGNGQENARLIKAAPKMLEALYQIATADLSRLDCATLCNIARAAIAEAVQS